MTDYTNGIDRNAGSAFRKRSRRAVAMSNLLKQMERGTRYDKTLMTHVAYNDADRGRLTTEYSRLVGLVG